MHGIQDGRDKELYRVVHPKELASPTVSRDGRQLAFVVMDQGLYLMPASGGEAREILRAPNVHGPGRLAWTADGRQVLVVRSTGSPGQTELWRVPVAGGEPQKIDLPAGLAFPSFHPDGRRLAFTGGRAGQKEVWVLENFLAALR